jgi:hypothetical protein
LSLAVQREFADNIKTGKGGFGNGFRRGRGWLRGAICWNEVSKETAVADGIPAA